MLDQHVADLLDRARRLVGGGQVDAARAVDLQVDQPRRQPAILDDQVGYRRRSRRRLHVCDSTRVIDRQRGRPVLAPTAQHAPPHHQRHAQV